jgi:protein tyrosine kinase modulator
MNSLPQEDGRLTEQNRARANDQDQSQIFGMISVRDLLVIVFRHIWLIILSFLAMSLAAVGFALVKQNTYESHMKILVKRERVDPLVTAEMGASPIANTGVSSVEVASEIELLRSNDLLVKVVVASGLDQLKDEDSWQDRILALIWPKDDTQESAADKEIKIAVLAQGLSVDLQIQPLTTSNLISVSYSHKDPEVAARVLNKLASLYLEKHLAVHRPAGTLEFFQQETARYRKGLADIEARMSDFSQSRGVISPEAEKEKLVNTIGEFQVKAKEAQASIAETQERIRSLKTQLASTPSRETTSIRTAENTGVVNQLKSRLSEFELKRIELLGKYEPGYRLVQELDSQIAQTKALLAEEEKVSTKDETSDWNPMYRMLNQTLATAQTELASYRARYSATVEHIRALQLEAQELERKEVAYHDLTRAQKMAEDNYQLYVKKLEESRISNAMDERRIVNVSLVEEATKPFAPVPTKRSLMVVAGSFLAGLSSLGLAFVRDFLDPTIRTPDEVKAILQIPVLAALPKSVR